MEVLRKIIVPILILVGIIVVGALAYKKEEGFDTTSVSTSNVSTSNACTSNVSGNSSTYNILNNILSKYGDKIANSTVAELTLDVNYDGRDISNNWPNYTSMEHELAEQMQSDALSKRDVKEMIHHELLENMGKTTGNQMYYDDGEDCGNDDSPSTMQGREHGMASRKRPIDMNEYIRKDSIPCWGCSIE